MARDCSLASQQTKTDWKKLKNIQSILKGLIREMPQLTERNQLM